MQTVAVYLVANLETTIAMAENKGFFLMAVASLSKMGSIRQSKSLFLSFMKTKTCVFARAMLLP